MKKIFFTPSSRGFFFPEIHGNPPSEAIEITRDEYDALLISGVDIDSNGNPSPRPRYKPSQQEVLASVKKAIRAQRAPMLDALTGIAGRAMRSGNEPLAAEADALAEQLLDITGDPALNAATTHEAMQAAGMAAYQRIASGANPELASVFKEITGS